MVNELGQWLSDYKVTDPQKFADMVNKGFVF